ncbi:3142_t:CDS:2, partial [Racocetra fulgida]
YDSINLENKNFDYDILSDKISQDNYKLYESLFQVNTISKNLTQESSNIEGSFQAIIQDPTIRQEKRKSPKVVVVIVVEQNVQLKVVHAAKTMHFVLDAV